MRATTSVWDQLGEYGTQLLWLILVSCCVAGCTSTPKPNWSEKEQSVPPLTLFLAPGDNVDISFLGAPELNTVQTVRRDGKITLRLIGELQAAGKTPEDLRVEIAKNYESQLQIKETSVIVKSPAPMFVTGSVLKPGRIETDRPMTVLEAIMESGGFDEREAEVRTVIVIRHQEGRRYGYSLNLKPALKGEEGYAFYLKPFDIVYVPRTFITKVDQWVDQHINRILPRLGIGYSPPGSDVTVYR